MEKQVVVLITGISKGSIRCDKSSPAVTDLLATQPAHGGSQLHLVHIESTSASDPAQAIEVIKALGIEHLDVVIANAGGGLFPTNAVGPLLLYQLCRTLLQKASSPKWISVPTGSGSISMIGAIRSYVGPAYGASKAALNWITLLVQTGPGNAVAQMFGMEKAPHTIEPCVERMMTVVSISFTSIDMRQALIPSAKIDETAREETSGKFIRAIEGTKIDW
ncbi:Short-chain dehydrogenase/reductase SDR [Apiospora kogelbergensis]|uniref:Short-chain dehydrogenase/reductase SDR n=1 Tax=Apiospora kogelbergensis TaxID=1337665 RepID=A0AAW0QFY6_9PEZI